MFQSTSKRVVSSLLTGCGERFVGFPHTSEFGRRLFSTGVGGVGHISVERDAENPEIAVLKLSRKPVNSLNGELLSQLNEKLNELERDSSVRALILTSAFPRMFSAGLDLFELYKPKREKAEHLWSQLQQTWISLYGSRLATVAAINGETFAGGCLLAMTCDYRVMAEGKYRIGLNETQIGIVAPTWFADTMINTIGKRQSDMLLQTGRLLPSSEAHRIGLVDELAPEAEVVSRAKRELKEKWLTIPDSARHTTKLLLRGETIEKLSKRRKEDVEHFISFVSSPSIQASIERYLNSLKAAASSKN
eukprot:TRINITY_DN13089_c0_g1_i1.p1 TRINITY_DN13089_c0_g1~~TRINITY_DN13089_c0_g1_i1.p1  ORF type:complete len:305 (+),score=73.14 TRINITY_DN13089_c0_g1_i1:41-955(+)